MLNTSARLICILLWIAPVLASENKAYEAWNQQDMIRVGLKSPKDTIELASGYPLLVLDGDKVVDRINPGGRFFIVHGKGRAGDTKRFVQIKATTNRGVLERDRVNLSKKYPDWQFSIFQTRGQMRALRVGPFDTNADGQQIKAAMVKEGFNDAFIRKVKDGYPFQWVDSNYDKHPIKAHDPAFVRENPNATIVLESTSYRGRLRLRHSGNDQIRVINELPLETYLRGVVPAEMGPAAYPAVEGLKAQAVAARTYVLKNMNRFNKNGYDICDGPACQAYGGASVESPMADQAVEETRGMVLRYDGYLIDALYTSTCGGVTDDVGNVFPGRNDPYLKSQTSYIAKFDAWDLPAKPVDTARYLGLVPEEIAIKAMIYGFPDIPDFRGDMTGEDLKAALNHLKWLISGDMDLPSGSLTVGAFWNALGSMDFFKDAIRFLVREEDQAILLRHHQVPKDLAPFISLLIRHDLIDQNRLHELNDSKAIPRAKAYLALLDLAEAFGPELEWSRFRLESVDGNRLNVTKRGSDSTIGLKSYQYYITDVSGKFAFVEAPKVQHWDRIYNANEPFSPHLLLVRESGTVASLDRFSAYDAWIEKKTVKDLEQRAKRYIKSIRGIRDVRVLKRSETGRVTLLEFEADSGTHRVDGLRIRWSLGVRDNMFELIPGYRNGRLVHLTVLGRGWGHGVGMSQVGAFSLAKMGWTYDQILKHYYTDVTVEPF